MMKIINGFQNTNGTITKGTRLVRVEKQVENVRFTCTEKLCVLQKVLSLIILMVTS